MLRIEMLKTSEYSDDMKGMVQISSILLVIPPGSSNSKERYPALHWQKNFLNAGLDYG
jgi:hypothetical protein